MDRARVRLLRGLADLELKARIRHVAEALDRYLPRPFPEGVVAVRRLLALPVEHQGDPPGGLSGWDLWPVPEWVMLAGRDEPEVALELLATCTRWASGEFAIRPFIDDDPAAVMARLRTWAARDDEHVRRLCTEGTRPLLPWAPRLAAARTEYVGLPCHVSAPGEPAEPGPSGCSWERTSCWCSPASVLPPV